jgi:hypothetical protein
VSEFLSNKSLATISKICEANAFSEILHFAACFPAPVLDPVAYVQSVVARLGLGPPKVRAPGVPYESLLAAFRRTIDFDGTVRHRVVDEGIAGLLDAGTAVIVNRFERSDDGLFDLANAIGRRRMTAASVNAYLAVGGSRSFGWHADDHDIVAVQISGTKCWQFSRLGSIGGGQPLCDAEYDVRAGDVLVIPRGWFHRAASIGEVASLHLSVGLYPLTMRRLLAVSVDHLFTGEDESLDLWSLEPGQRAAQVRLSIDRLEQFLRSDPLLLQEPEQEDVHPMPGYETM